MAPQHTFRQRIGYWLCIAPATILDDEVKPEEGLPEQKVEQTKIALRELGLNEDISTDK